MNASRIPQPRRYGFTLVELLVVIGIIALLISILLPALNKARSASVATKCQSNLRSVGQGFAQYLAENKQVYPAAYLYVVDPANGAPPSVAGGGTADSPTRGYVHWSWFIYSSGRNKGVGQESFKCPALEDGGLPPTNPSNSARIEGQQNDPVTPAGVIDQQVDRIAYTVNEAIIPRNKFGAPIDRYNGGAKAQYVKASRIRKSSDVILATEFVNNWRIVSSASEGENVVKSHRPVHGLEISSTGGSAYDFSSPLPFNQNIRPFKQNLTTNFPPIGDENRLNWVGRNHPVGGTGKKARTNFLYCDGHVETKTIEETLAKPNWQWGEKVYSLQGEPLIQGVEPR